VLAEFEQPRQPPAVPTVADALGLQIPLDAERLGRLARRAARLQSLGGEQAAEP
jgi:hypothetical protein